MQLDGAEKGSKQECYFYCTHELMRARGRMDIYKNKKSDCNPALPDLSLHVEKYRYSSSSLFLQLQPPKNKAKPSQFVNAMLLQSLLLKMISITTSKNVRMAVCLDIK